MRKKLKKKRKHLIINMKEPSRLKKPPFNTVMVEDDQLNQPQPTSYFGVFLLVFCLPSRQPLTVAFRTPGCNYQCCQCARAEGRKIKALNNFDPYWHLYN